MERGLVGPSEIRPQDSIELEGLGLSSPVLWHKRVPWVTYAHEWSFSMLKDAALMTLEMMDELLQQDLILKDATPYNCMFLDQRPSLIDILSIDSFDELVWKGYSQFSRTFIFPLMLSAHKGLAFNSVLRASPDGLPVGEIRKLFTLPDILKRGVFSHIVMQASLKKRFDKGDWAELDAPSGAGLHKGIVLRLVRKRRILIEALSLPSSSSLWLRYERENSYNSAAAAEKTQFLEEWLSFKKRDRIVDLGCNIGMFSKLAANQARFVAALDSDPHCIEALYLSCKRDCFGNIQPVVADLLNPSPGLGWNNQERQPLLQRLSSDGFLALALVHHICIGGNIPLGMFTSTLADLGAEGVVEWVEAQDPMAKQMLKGRRNVFQDYTWEYFLSALQVDFRVIKIKEIDNGMRRLVSVERTSRPA